MNLVIDVGNTLVKFAVFNGDDLLHKLNAPINELTKILDTIYSEYPLLAKAIVSSVAYLSTDHIDAIKKRLKLVILNEDIKLPFKNAYKTPHTLGMDRVALASASVKYFSKKNVLIIDAGTCITYDVMTKDNTYLGGAISPGIRLRYTSLNNLTANLPLLQTNLPKDILGTSTQESIHSGVVNGVVLEIDGVIDVYKDKYPDLTVILTGGDANFLSNQLKNSIFAHSDFLLEGLNYILEFNSL